MTAHETNENRYLQNYFRPINGIPNLAQPRVVTKEQAELMLDKYRKAYRHGNFMFNTTIWMLLYFPINYNPQRLLSWNNLTSRENLLELIRELNRKYPPTLIATTRSTSNS